MIVDAMIDGDVAERDDLLSQLKLIDASNYERLKTAAQSSGAITDPSVLQDLNLDILNNSLTLDNILKAQSDGKLSNEDARSMIGKLGEQRNKDHTMATKYIKNSIMPEKGDGFITLFNDGDVERAKDIADIENELMLEIQADPSINRFNWALSRIERYKAEKVAAKAQKKRRDAEALLKDLTIGKNKRFDEGTSVQTIINLLLNAGDDSMADTLKVLVQ